MAYDENMYMRWLLFLGDLLMFAFSVGICFLSVVCSCLVFLLLAVTNECNLNCAPPYHKAEATFNYQIMMQISYMLRPHFFLVLSYKLNMSLGKAEIIVNHVNYWRIIIEL